MMTYGSNRVSWVYVQNKLLRNTHMGPINHCMQGPYMQQETCMLNTATIAAARDVCSQCNALSCDGSTNTLSLSVSNKAVLLISLKAPSIGG